LCFARLSLTWCYFFQSEVASIPQFGGTSQFPPGQFPQGQFPQLQFQQGQFPQVQYPQTQFAPAQFPPQGQVQFQQGRQPGTFQVGTTSLFLWCKDVLQPLEKQQELCEEAANLLTTNHSCTHVCSFDLEVDNFARHSLYLRLGWRFRNQTLLKNMGKLR
jgi:hypothetical protein